ncbi:MAG: thiamine-phosphate kinase [Planctomycetota bacterium]|nr:thiamine-phosphate kinase [Planctomycetota bacterium]
MSELDLIDHVRSFNAGLGPRIVLPPGDDLGGLRVDESSVLLSGVDLVIGGVHRPVDADPERYARKSLRRSLSDVAAMAAVPLGAVVTVALPAGTPDDWGRRFAEALNEDSRRWETPVFGGDVAGYATTDPPPLVTVTVVAEGDPAAEGRYLTRDGARPGDLVWVSGVLGGSLEKDGGGHHEAFEPRLELARTLHRTLGPDLHCLIDLSDGLVRDAAHLAEASGVRMNLELERLPCRPGATAREALTDGEDYELCFTTGAGVALPDTLAGVPLTRIGTVEAGDSISVTEGGRTVPLPSGGWEHLT